MVDHLKPGFIALGDSSVQGGVDHSLGKQLAFCFQPFKLTPHPADLDLDGQYAHKFACLLTKKIGQSHAITGSALAGWFTASRKWSHRSLSMEL